MRLRLRRLVFFAAIVSFSSELAAKPGILGKRAPELAKLVWYDNANKVMKKSPTLADLKGKVVVLKFWQSWCPGCMSHGLPTLYKLQEHFKNNDRVKLFAVQTVFEGFWTNKESKLKDIRKRFKLTVPMAHDDGSGAGLKKSALMAQYRTGGTPWFVVINPEGLVVFNGFGIDYDKSVKLINKMVAKTSRSN